jgi:2-polyprenyl-3-methyl-5-hydroxy-6-metoxy-1,4-benzoquinol methylase
MKRLHDANINTPEWFDHVWSLEKVHRYDAVRLRALLDGMDESKRYLDVGAGWWGAAQYAVHHGFPGRYTALDFSQEARRRTLAITPTLEYAIADARAMPYADGYFDVVACGELIEHMENVGAFVAELARVCKPGGRIIISTLIAECDAAIRHGDYPEHLWAFTPAELIAAFETIGPTEYRTVGDYHIVSCKKGQSK